MMIPVTLYASAHTTTPMQVDHFASWREFRDEFPELVNQEAPSKAACFYWAPYEMAEGATRADANVSELSLMVTDLDALPAGVPDILERLRAAGVAALVYESPSSTDDAPRVRIVTPVTEPIPADKCAHTRLAFAEALGLEPGCGANGVPPPSIGFYVGRVAGTRERKVWHVEGKPADTAALVAAPLAHAWSKGGGKKLRGDPSDSRESGGRLAGSTPDRSTISPDYSTRVLELAAMIEARWLAGDREHGNFEKAFYGWLLARGWSRGEVVALVECLDNEEPDAGKRAEHGRKARTAAPLSGVAPVVTAWFGPLWEGVDLLVNAKGREWSARVAARRAAAPRETRDEPEEDTGTFILVARRDPGHVLLREDDDVGFQPVALNNLRLRIAEKRLPIALGTKKPFSPVAIIERDGRTFGEAVYDFGSRASRYEPSLDRVIVGYPVRPIEAQFDHDVDAWLRALAPPYERLEQVIASCSQENAMRLAAAVVLVAPKDCGKTLFARCLAGMWRAEEPVSASLLIARFNGDLTRCPIVFDDEAKLLGSERLSTKHFREIVQSVERQIERKGRECFTLRGAARLVVACNGLGDLRFADVTGRDVVDAVADRLLVVVTQDVSACRDALERLRLPGGYLCDRDRIVRHFAWIAENVALARDRFVGSGGDASVIAVLAGHVASNADLFETLHAWLDAKGDAGPWYIREGVLYADRGALAGGLAMKGRGWDLARANAALEPFREGDARIRVGDRRVRVARLDAARVARAVGVSVEAILGRER